MTCCIFGGVKSAEAPPRLAASAGLFSLPSCLMLLLIFTPVKIPTESHPPRAAMQVPTRLLKPHPLLLMQHSDTTSPSDLSWPRLANGEGHTVLADLRPAPTGSTSESISVALNLSSQCGLTGIWKGIGGMDLPIRSGMALMFEWWSGDALIWIGACWTWGH